jgi:hypothetical protein
MAKAPPVNLPLVHRFTPGMYVREVFMPAGVLVTTPIHLTEHPFTIIQGVVDVYQEGIGVERLTAPYVGITKPGTRRLLLVREDTIWVTFHVTTLTDVKEIEDTITQVPSNPFLPLGYQHVELIRGRAQLPEGTL